MTIRLEELDKLLPILQRLSQEDRDQIRKRLRILFRRAMFHPIKGALAASDLDLFKPSRKLLRRHRDKIRVAWAFLSFMLSDAVYHLDLTHDAWVIRRPVATYIVYFSGKTEGPFYEDKVAK